MDDVVQAFVRDGFAPLGQIVSPADCDALMRRLRASRNFGPDIFLSQAAFEANPQHRGVNPVDGRNLLQTLSDDADFILKTPALHHVLTTLLGDDFMLLNAKFVCGVPDAWLPAWLRPRILGNPVNNLGAYIKPEYRDITYFYGIDYHQDIIDWKSRLSDFITLYVYIHPVTVKDAPLYVLPGSHRFGATVFPHALTPDPATPHGWVYGDGAGRQTAVRELALVGETGSAALWHACTLHGTQPVASDAERFSVRYLIARGQAATAAIDLANAAIEGPLALEQTRRDLDAAGAAQIKGNIITGQSA